jgi:nicotinamide riboside kinase
MDEISARWRQLPEAVRLESAVRIILVGSESTGTTTLSVALIDHYRTRFPAIVTVEEYGRQFTYDLLDEVTADAIARGLPTPGMDDLVWTPGHFATIAREQTALEDSAALACPLVIADTDALATELWERRYLDATTGSAQFAGPLLPRRDLYLVTDHVGVPFEADEIRDGEHLRATMTGWFTQTLTDRGYSWLLVTGSREKRLGDAVAAIDPLLTRLAPSD